LFEPFTQHEQGRDRAGGGLGLGLAIASRLARLQAGTLSAASAGLDQGASFTLRMPIADRSDGPRRLEPPAPPPDRQTVLVVEDNEDMAGSLADVLELMGFDVRVVHDGASALTAALAVVPDLILCDLGLPGLMDGLAVARTCRGEASLRSVRLVAVSGYSSPQDHAAARIAGFDCLLTKPVTRDSLRSIARSASH
jgi:CheY-like chemotaxis protein